jgi:hypothetical protein
VIDESNGIFLESFLKRCLTALLGPALLCLALLGISSALAAQEYDPFERASGCMARDQASPYLPLDSWVYPAMLRLQAMGYVDTVFAGMRPWTRSAVADMLGESEPILQDAENNSTPTAPAAGEIIDAIAGEIGYARAGDCLRDENRTLRVESAYTALRGLTGPVLRDSFHLGSTLVNDFGRPYQKGFNSYTGWSGYSTVRRFTLYLRGEFETAGSGIGYSTGLASALSGVDLIPFLNPSNGQPYGQATIPLGPIPSQAHGRLLEGYLAGRVLGHTVSLGKQDEWLGPGQGGAMAYSNNAENVYAFHVSRPDPLEIPWLSRLTGPFRYEFLVGGLLGHTYVPASNSVRILPGAPWVHVEKVSFRPTENLTVGFERTVIWGGKGHEPITLHTFLRSFFSLSAPDSSVKNSDRDPGARFGAFDFSYRLPFLRQWLTLYSDSEVHDDVSPIDAPRRASIRPGLYLSHFPRLNKLDLRVEAVSTDPSISSSQGGKFMYYEGIVRQGYTNHGQLFGDWIGREDKGGQAWITWHLSPEEWVQASFRNQKAAKDFVSGGTTLNDFGFQVIKRIGRDLELKGQFNLEYWKAPLFPTGTLVYPAPRNAVSATTVQFTWFPQGRVHF